MCIHTIYGEEASVEKADTRFSIQSISKVFALAMCLSIKGDELWKKVGKEPSGSSFNSLIQLEVEKGVPRNPFLNARAIVMADILYTHLENPEEDFLSFVRAVSGMTLFAITKRWQSRSVRMDTLTQQYVTCSNIMAQSTMT